jgi:hypothetical protein
MPTVWTTWRVAAPMSVRSIWASARAALTFTATDPDTLQQYAYMQLAHTDLQTADLDRIDRIRGHLIRAAVLARHAPGAISTVDGFNRAVMETLDQRNVDAIDTTGAPAFAKDVFDAQVLCPAVWSARLMMAACDAMSGAEGCPPPNDASAAVWADTLARAEKRGACAAELTAAPADLLFSAEP